MPRHAESARGYVAYTAAAAQSGYLLSSWCNYTHQQSLLQYPAVTAMEKRMTSAFGNAGAFYTVQHALQFFPEDAQDAAMNAKTTERLFGSVFSMHRVRGAAYCRGRRP